LRRVVGAAASYLTPVQQVPLLRDLFHFAPPSRGKLLLAMLIGLASIA